MNNSALKESTVEKNTQTSFMWIRKKVSLLKSYKYELAFDTSKPFISLAVCRLRDRGIY